MDASMNVAKPQPLQGVPPQRQIPDELDRLTAGVDRLEGVFSNLLDRLSPALRESAPTPPPPGEAMPEPTTVIARRIQDEYHRVARMVEVMGDALGRCEL